MSNTSETMWVQCSLPEAKHNNAKAVYINNPINLNRVSTFRKDVSAGFPSIFFYDSSQANSVVAAWHYNKVEDRDNDYQTLISSFAITLTA